MHSIMERAQADEICGALIGRMCAMGLECRMSELRELKTYSPTSSVYVLDIVRE